VGGCGGMRARMSLLRRSIEFATFATSTPNDRMADTISRVTAVVLGAGGGGITTSDRLRLGLGGGIGLVSLRVVGLPKSLESLDKSHF
jgi:hypothetical protein